MINFLVDMGDISVGVVLLDLVVLVDVIDTSAGLTVPDDLVLRRLA